MMTRKRWQVLVLLAGWMLASAGCDLLVEESSTSLVASGVVEAVQVVVSSELPGRVAEVLVTEGDRVEVGAELFRLEGEGLAAQQRAAQAALELAQANLASAQAALEAAEAGVAAAHMNLESAHLQAELERQRARQADQPDRLTQWDQDLPDEFALPDWYFTREDSIRAAEAEVFAAREALETEFANLGDVLADASNADLQAAEIRLAEAQAAFLVAESLQDRDIDPDNRAFVEDFSQVLLDAAEAELESAQSEYEQILSEAASDEVLEARARLAVTRERMETALDRLQSLMSGERSVSVQVAESYVRQAEIQVAIAEASVAQARAGVTQTERGVAQARAALESIAVEMEKLVVHAAVEGVVITRNLEPGEVVQPGSTALTVGQLDQMTITVFIPEDRYGQIGLNDRAQVTVDSFPGAVFDARVLRIADQAEFTPRNVQTVEERRTTVFAVELAVDDPEGRLKPGMPADVEF